MFVLRLLRLKDRILMMFFLANILSKVKMKFFSRKSKIKLREMHYSFCHSYIFSHFKQVSKLVSFVSPPIIHILSRLMKAYGFNYQVYVEDMQSYSFFLTFLMKLVPNSNICQIIYCIMTLNMDQQKSS